MKKAKKQRDPIKEWYKKALELERQGLEITVIGRYPKPGFGMPKEEKKKT